MYLKIDCLPLSGFDTENETYPADRMQVTCTQVSNGGDPGSIVDGRDLNFGVICITILEPDIAGQKADVPFLQLQGMWGYSRVVDGIEEFVTKMALCFRVKCLVFSVFAVEREYVLSCLVNLITWIYNFKQEIKSNQH